MVRRVSVLLLGCNGGVKMRLKPPSPPFLFTERRTYPTGHPRVKCSSAPPSMWSRSE